MINQYELEKEAKRIVEEAEASFEKYGDNPYDFIHQTCEGHEWVIYTYKAIELCQECDRDDAEDMMRDCGETEFASFGNYANRLAYYIMIDACNEAWQ